jgi:nickel-type superoxide dismutase maturation protease
MHNECLKQRFSDVLVSGDSMLPTIRDGESVRVDLQAYTTSQPRVDEVVLVRHPFVKDMRMIKRITAIENGRYVVRGDNARESTDSRSFGSLAISQILGRIC